MGLSVGVVPGVGPGPGGGRMAGGVMSASAGLAGGGWAQGVWCENFFKAGNPPPTKKSLGVGGKT